MIRIPAGWKNTTLCAVCEINPRLKNKPASETLVSFIPMDGVSNDGGLAYTITRTYQEVSKGFTSFSEDDVLFAKITPCMENGKGAYASGLKNLLGFGSTEFHVLRAKENIDSRYVYQLVHWKNFRLNAESNMTGSAGQKRVPTDFLKDYVLPIPPLSEQKKIAEILSSVDRSIEATQKLIAKLSDLKKALMQQLFTKGIGHTKFKDSPLGRIPEEWEVVNINKISSKVGSGVTPKGGHTVYQATGIKLIRSQNVYPNELRVDDIACISEEINAGMKNTEIQEHDVLLNITGASIGRCCFVPDKFGRANVNQHVCIIRCKKTYNYLLLSQFLNSHFGQGQIARLQAGGNREGLNFQQIKEIKIPQPSASEQNQIASILSAEDKRIEKAKSRLEKLKDLKKGLMNDLLTGKVRV